jgi:hypothetical protein
MKVRDSGVGNKNDTNFLGESRRPQQFGDLNHRRFRESAEMDQINPPFALPV